MLRRHCVEHALLAQTEGGGDQADRRRRQEFLVEGCEGSAVVGAGVLEMQTVYFGLHLLTERRSCQRGCGYLRDQWDQAV